MRAFLRILVGIVLLTGAWLPVAQAGVQETIEQACRQYILKQTQWAPEDMELTFRRYICPEINWDGVNLEITHPGSADLSGLVTVRVTVFRGKEELRSFPVPLEITLYDEVLVTTRGLKRKEVISPADVLLERREVKLRDDRPLTALEEGIGYRLRRTLTPGTMLTRSAIEENPLVLQGEKVTIRYQIANLLLTAMGEAIEDGWRDRPVRVKNLSSKKLITGIPVDNGVIEILRPGAGG